MRTVEIELSEEVYQQVEALAKEQERTVEQQVQYVVRMAMVKTSEADLIRRIEDLIRRATRPTTTFTGPLWNSPINTEKLA